MEKIHCECCDEVIPSKVPRLTLKPGVAKGDHFDSEETDRDYCLKCARTQSDKILQDIVNDWKEELNAK